jgi:hypothetical protein
MMANGDDSASATEDPNDPAPPAAPNPAPALAPPALPPPAEPAAPAEVEIAPGLWLPDVSQADYLDTLVRFCTW